jgi:phosphopantothenoylcysteine decarboxylase / phosphopantothenate---cysteine ligase
MARVLLGVTGGIAGYRALELARLATRAGHAVRVLMTPTAERFVGRASFEGIVGAPVLVGEFERDPLGGRFPGENPGVHDPISHLELSARADAYLVAPASANTIAKLAAGLCDSMLTTSFLACRAPRAVAPAMNDRMLRDPATEANLTTLAARGVRVIPPDEGALASRGEYGMGRLPAPETLLVEVEAMLPATPGPWDGLRVLVTAGGTREPIDPVRFIGNRSSGRMGLALSERAAARGADVTLVAANVSLASSPAVRRIDVERTAEMAAAVAAELPQADILLMAAAVADFRPERAAAAKLERFGGELDLHLTSTEDIVAAAARAKRPGQTIVGFAAEHGAEAVERAASKLERKGLDAIVFNDVSRPDIGFDSERNEVTILDRAGRQDVPLAPKEEVADAVLDRVEALRATRPARPYT